MYKRNINCGDARMTQKRLSLYDTLRRLWMEHVLWTRSFIVSAVFGLPDLNMVTNRLLRNPADFADVLRPFYGEIKAARFKNLLTEHLQIAGDLVVAAKAGDSAKADVKRREWYANADDIACFLSEINPYWNKKAWQTLLYDHLKMTEDEAGQMLKGQYDASIAQFDAIQEEALEMADYMAEGIFRQFGL